MLTYIRILRIVAVSAAVGFLAAWGQYSWSSQMERAAERADKNVRIVEEYVLRVVLTQEALLAEADEATDGFTWDEISASKFVHERLKRTGDRSGNSSSIGLIDPSGRIRNSGRAFPVDTDVSDREYFQKIRDGTVPLFIGDRMRHA